MSDPVGSSSPAPHGILLFDKPEGWSSQHAVTRIKKLLRLPKAGHGGTLDPFATGMLPVLLGHATRYADFLLSERKAYQLTVALGTQTDTGDPTGQITAEAPVPAFSLARLNEVLVGFEGEQWQEPPAYSALKHEGKPLYAYARAGQPITKPKRRITLHQITLDAHTPHTVTLTVLASKGAYMRVLASDLAQSLGTVGHAQALRRLWSAPFEHAPLWTWEGLCAHEGAWQDVVLPVQDTMPQVPSLVLDAPTAQLIQQGQGCPQEGHGLVQLRVTGGAWLGLGVIEEGWLKAKRLLPCV